MTTTLDIKKPVFGNKSSASADGKQRAKAQIWLNVGFTVEVQNDAGETETRFISLPMGMPLDTMEEVATNSSNTTFAAMQVAKNDLLKQMLGAAGKLESGQDVIVKGVEVQIRRVNAEGTNPALSDPKINPFLKQFDF